MPFLLAHFFVLACICMSLVQLEHETHAHFADMVIGNSALDVTLYWTSWAALVLAFLVKVKAANVGAVLASVWKEGLLSCRRPECPSGSCRVPLTLSDIHTNGGTSLSTLVSYSSESRLVGCMALQLSLG